MSFDAFISYSKADQAAAHAACATLENAGIRCWIASRDIVPGLEWSAAIVNAIDNCRIMILIFSSHANQSRQIRREVERAADRGITVVPLRVEDVPPVDALAYFLGSVHWLAAFPQPLEAHLEPLVQAARSLLEIRPGNGAVRDASPVARRSGIQPNPGPAVAARPRPRLRLQSLQGQPRSRWLVGVQKLSGGFAILGTLVLTVAFLLVLIVEPSTTAALLTLLSGSATGVAIYSYLRKAPLSREVTLGLQGDRDEIIEACVAALKKMEATIDSVDIQTGRIEANTGLGWRSFGETLMIDVIETGISQYSVRIRSHNQNPSTLIDWGKNASNIHRFVDELTR